jgi:hypothetical protein
MVNGAIEKSTRHSKIAGDFGEAVLLYWLSRSGSSPVLAGNVRRGVDGCDSRCMPLPVVLDELVT